MVFKWVVEKFYWKIFSTFFHFSLCFVKDNRSYFLSTHLWIQVGINFLAVGQWYICFFFHCQTFFFTDIISIYKRIVSSDFLFKLFWILSIQKKEYPFQRHSTGSVIYSQSCISYFLFNFFNIEPFIVNIAFLNYFLIIQLFLNYNNYVFFFLYLHLHFNDQFYCLYEVCFLSLLFKIKFSRLSCTL